MTAQKLRWRVRRYFCYRRLFRTKANPPESNFVIRARTGGAVISCCSDIFFVSSGQGTNSKSQGSYVVKRVSIWRKTEAGRESNFIRFVSQFSSVAQLLFFVKVSQLVPCHVGSGRGVVGCGVINGVRGPRLVRRKLQDDGTVLYGFGPNWMQDKVQLLFLFPSKMRWRMDISFFFCLINSSWQRLSHATW